MHVKKIQPVYEGVHTTGKGRTIITIGNCSKRVMAPSSDLQIATQSALSLQREKKFLPEMLNTNNIHDRSYPDYIEEIFYETIYWHHGIVLAYLRRLRANIE